MNGNLIDTNIIIKLLGADLKIIKFFDNLNSINIPVITLGELFYGAAKSSRKENNRKIFSDFINEYSVINITANTANTYGEIKYKLKKEGVNIPENDLWIASIAISENLRLITCDRHFEKIDRLESCIIQ